MKCPHSQSVTDRKHSTHQNTESQVALTLIRFLLEKIDLTYLLKESSVIYYIIDYCHFSSIINFWDIGRNILIN